MTEDLPTLDLPAKAISGRRAFGKSLGAAAEIRNCYDLSGQGLDVVGNPDNMICDNYKLTYCKTFTQNINLMEKYQGFAADLAAACCLLISSLTGIPVSTTHTKTTAIMGVGAARRLSSVNWGVVKEMVLTWILTFPGCGLLAFLVTKLFLLIFK